MIARLAIPFIWLIDAALVLRLWNVWDRLPERVAVHFGIAMEPNSWSSRTAMAVMVVLALAVHAGLATWLIARYGAHNAMIAVILITVATVLVSAFWQMIAFNVDGKPFQAAWVLVPVLLMLGLVSVFVFSAMVRQPFH